MSQRPEGIELIKTLQEQLIATGDPVDAERAGYLAVMLQARGEDLTYNPRMSIAEATQGKPEQTADAPVLDLFSRVYPEISLTEEHQRQGLILAGQFAKRLKFETAESYIATLPDFPDRLDNYAGLGLNVPLIVEKRVPWLEAAELSGIYVTDYLRGRANEGQVSEWTGDKFDTSQVAFTAWAQDGTKFVYRKPSEVRNELVSRKEYGDYRAGRNLDAIALASVRPDLVKTMFWDVIGNSVGSVRVPSLYWVGRPGLGADRVVGARLDFRALVLGREIRTLNLTA